MKKKTDDLEKLDGVAVPTWAKVLAFAVSFAAAFGLYYLIFILGR